MIGYIFDYNDNKHNRWFLWDHRNVKIIINAIDGPYAIIVMQWLQHNRRDSCSNSSKTLMQSSPQSKCVVWYGIIACLDWCIRWSYDNNNMLCSSPWSWTSLCILQDYWLLMINYLSTITLSISHHNHRLLNDFNYLDPHTRFCWLTCEPCSIMMHHIEGCYFICHYHHMPIERCFLFVITIACLLKFY